ncbi:hypothetical protein [Streptomyces sp. NPDC050988]|uniref:hypothetical protein n=1 Tax=Streptomyces sp. NPDC050988 TaxID=3365637 RepID=UPI003798C34D
MPLKTVGAARARLARRDPPGLRHLRWTKGTVSRTASSGPMTAVFGRGAPSPLKPPAHAPYLLRQRADVDRAPTSPNPRYLNRTPKRYRRAPTA